MNCAPIFIVDDDLDDQDFLKEAWDELEFKNPLKFFKNADEILAYLKQEEEIPFLIISNFYLNKTTGLELKQKLLQDESINYKSIPFVFFSDTATKAQVEKSYDLGSNGFFVKGKNIQEIRDTLADIVNYWQRSQTPY